MNEEYLPCLKCQRMIHLEKTINGYRGNCSYHYPDGRITPLGSGSCHYRKLGCPNNNELKEEENV